MNQQLQVENKNLKTQLNNTIRQLEQSQTKTNRS